MDYDDAVRRQLADFFGFRPVDPPGPDDGSPRPPEPLTEEDVARAEAIYDFGVAAAKELRDDQLARMRSMAAIGKIRPGQRVTILWPGGFYDFVIEFMSAELDGAEGWVILRGLVVEPVGPEHRVARGFSVRPLDDGTFTLRPRGES